MTLFPDGEGESWASTPSRTTSRLWDGLIRG